MENYHQNGSNTSIVFIVFHHVPCGLEMHKALGLD